MAASQKLVGGFKISTEPRTKTLPYFPRNAGCFIGILIMVRLQPLYHWVVCHPLYNPKQPPFFHCSSEGFLKIHSFFWQTAFVGCVTFRCHRIRKGTKKHIENLEVSLPNFSLFFTAPLFVNTPNNALVSREIPQNYHKFASSLIFPIFR